MRVLSVDLGIRHLAWFTGELHADESADVGTRDPPLLHVIGVGTSIEWDVVDIVPPPGVDNVNLVRVEELVPWLQTGFTQHKRRMLYLGEQPVERVYLEQQPVGTGEAAARNIKTKVLSHVLQALILQELPGIQIEFVSPRKKLRHAAHVLGKAPETYADNKRAAKLLTPRALRSLGGAAHALEFETRKGKKDDLADSFLQAVYAYEDNLEEVCIQRRREARQEKREVNAAEPKRKRASKKSRDSSETYVATAAASAALVGPLDLSLDISSLGALGTGDVSMLPVLSMHVPTLVPTVEDSSNR